MWYNVRKGVIWMNGIAVALFFNFLDLLTGIVYAVKEKEIESVKLRNGIFKKSGFIFCYILGYMFDRYSVYFGVSVAYKVLPVILAYVLITELCSIIENIHKINSEILPQKLLQFFNVKKE